MFYAIVSYNDGNHGRALYSSAPEKLPDNQVECTKEQYDDYANYKIVDGKVVSIGDEALLLKTKITQIALLNKACRDAIVSGISSSALGEEYFYPSDITDQANLNANVTTSLLPNLLPEWVTYQMCMDSKGVWNYLPHTAVQIQQVGSDLKEAILNMRMKLAMLSNQINDPKITNLDDVKSIIW